jgi:hypothetical protein
MTPEPEQGPEGTAQNVPHVVKHSKRHVFEEELGPGVWATNPKTLPTGTEYEFTVLKIICDKAFKACNNPENLDWERLADSFNNRLQGLSGYPPC